jgi:5-methylthioadenosine/S-adenosylhomocysteine deaminase
LGSDGYINDFFEVMRGAFLIHKAYHQNPQVMPAHDVWYLATEGGARALGWEKSGA